MNLLLKVNDINRSYTDCQDYVSVKRMLNTITLNLYNFSGAGGDQHVIEGEMVNLPEPSIDAPCPPDYSSYDEIAADYASGNLNCF